MKSIILTVILSIMLINCTSDDNNDNQFVLDIGVEFNIKDRFGNDLLNNNTYNVDDMKLFYLINGDMEEVYNPSLDNPRNILLINEVTPFRIAIGTNASYNEFITEENGIKKGEHIAYLQLNENDTDTIKTEWVYKENAYFRNTKISYNGEDKTQEIDNNGYFVLTK